jgi:hypothetical protein
MDLMNIGVFEVVLICVICLIFLFVAAGIVGAVILFARKIKNKPGFVPLAEH